MLDAYDEIASRPDVYLDMALARGDIQLLSNHTVVHARTAYEKPDGTQGAGRYTDDWQLRDGRWQCVSAHVTRL